MRTQFVNPGFFENPRKGRKRKGKSSKRRGRGRARGRRYSRKPRYRRFSARGRIRMRNAGIAPFMQNPLILSNPRQRRRRSNPSLPSMKSSLSGLVSGMGGAAIALAVNAVAINRIDNAWFRRAAQAAVAGAGGAMIGSKSPKLGAAVTGAMMYPLLQDLAADLLGIGVGAGVTAKEADIEALAADLEDVLDDMDGLAEDDEEYAW